MNKMILFIVVFALVPIAFAATCGDGLCGPTETQANCAADCGSSMPACTVTVNAGGSVQSAINAASSGAVICLADGTYTGRFNVNKAGLTLRSLNFRGAVITNGIDIPVGSDNTLIEGLKFTAPNTQSASGVINSQADYVKIYYNHIYDAYGSQFGIIVGDWSGSYHDKNGIVKGNFLKNVRYGIRVIGDNFLVEGNEIEDFKYSGSGSCPTNTMCFDYMWWFGNNMIIRGNYFHMFNNFAGTVADSHVDCYQTDGGNSWLTYNTTFENNTCINFHQAIIATGSSVNGGFTIRNNVFIQLATGVALQSQQALLLNQNNVVIEHNTIGGNTNYGIVHNSGTNKIIRYNIFMHEPSRAYEASGAAVSYNVYWDTTQGTPTAATNLNANPLFVDEANNNYHLQSSSPACNIGGSYAGAFPCGGAIIYDPADTNQDGCISLGEISAYVTLWLQGQVTLGQVSSSVAAWLGGC